MPDRLINLGRMKVTLEAPGMKITAEATAANITIDQEVHQLTANRHGVRVPLREFSLGREIKIELIVRGELNFEQFQLIESSEGDENKKKELIRVIRFLQGR